MSWERDFVKVLLPANLDLQANYHLVYMNCHLPILCNECNISTNFFTNQLVK